MGWLDDPVVPYNPLDQYLARPQLPPSIAQSDVDQAQEGLSDDDIAKIMEGWYAPKLYNRAQEYLNYGGETRPLLQREQPMDEAPPSPEIIRSMMDSVPADKLYADDRSDLNDMLNSDPSTQYLGKQKPQPSPSPTPQPSPSRLTQQLDAIPQRALLAGNVTNAAVQNATDWQGDPVVGITPDWQSDPIISSPEMSPEEMSRTGQISYEPSSVTAGTEPTKASEALRANIQPMLEHPIRGLGEMFTNWDDIKHLVEHPEDIPGPVAKRAAGLEVKPEEEIGSQNWYNTAVAALLGAGAARGFRGKAPAETATETAKTQTWMEPPADFDVNGGYGPSASKSVLSTQEAINKALGLVGKENFEKMLQQRLEAFGTDPDSPQVATHVENLARKVVSDLAEAPESAPVASQQGFEPEFGQAAYHGDTRYTLHRRGNNVEVSEIRANNAGGGMRFLKALTQWADNNGITLSGDARPMATKEGVRGLPQDKLKKLYRFFGFEEYGNYDRMLRPPKQAIPEPTDALERAESPPVGQDSGVAQSEAKVGNVESSGKITQAAIRMPDGEVFAAPTHGQAIEKAELSNPNYQFPLAETGFIDESGNFLTIKEQASLQAKAGQSGLPVRINAERVAQSEAKVGNVEPAVEAEAKPMSPASTSAEKWDAMSPEDRFSLLAGLNPFDAALRRKQYWDLAGMNWADLPEGGNLRDVIGGRLPKSETLANPAKPDTFTPESETKPPDNETVGGEPAGQRPPVQERAAGVATPEAQAAGGEGGVSIKNASTDTLRERYGLEPAVQEARKSLDTSWAESEALLRQDPGIGRRMVDDILSGRLKAIDDTQVGLLTHETIDAVAERNAAADAVNSAKTQAEIDSAKARQALAEERLQNVVDADRKVGTGTARGLKARQMAAREDYSLTRMESRARAAYGRKLSKEESARESAYVKGLNDKIQELSDRIDQMESKRKAAPVKPKEFVEGAKEAKRSGKRIVDYFEDAEAKARERIHRQLHGLGVKPAPPTLIADYAIVGASHIARGVTKFADWSAAMVKEFGDKIKPYLSDIYKRARVLHGATYKAYDAERPLFRLQSKKGVAGIKSRIAKQTIELEGKIKAGDFTKKARQESVPDRSTYQMRQKLRALKGEFDRHVADIERKNATPGQKLVTHIAGLLRAGVLSSPGVIGKLGVAAVVKEGGAPLYGLTRWGYSKVPGLSRIAEMSGRNPSLLGILDSEIKAKSAAVTKGIVDSFQSFTKRGSELDRMAGKDKYTRYWYDKLTGSVHAAIKAPVKRAEFTRSLEQRVETAMRQGEDVSHPAVIDRLTNEAAIDADRAILQNSNAFSNWIGQLDRMGPQGKILKAILSPVSRVPSNLVIEFWNHALGVPHGLLRSAYHGATRMENLSRSGADSIMRQFSQGTVGLALASYAWLNHEKISEMLHSLPKWFQHTSQAMVLQLFSALGEGDQKEIDNMVKYDIPFIKTFTDLSEPLTNSSKPPHMRSDEPWAEYGRKQLAGRLIPEVANYVRKSEYTPGSWWEKAIQWNKPEYPKEETQAYFHPKSIKDAIKNRLP